ncbi:MAG: 30S ribosomal protein S16 [Ardenticatenales bacterium]|nr:30S ribosomal protein S16 [Ardenticatenales bacterium]
MVRIRLRRVGAKKKPSYRIVVADQRSPRDGRFIETIGHYDPRTDPPTVVIKEARALHWLSVGAQPSGPVERFFTKLGLADKVKKIHGGASIESLVAPVPEAATPKAEAKPARGKAAKAASVADVPAEDASLLDRAKHTAAAAAAAAAPAIDAAEAALEKAGDAIEHAVDVVSDAAAPVVEDVVEGAKKAAHVVADAAEPVVEGAKKAAHTVAEGAKKAAHVVADVVSDAAEAVVEKAADVTEALADAVTGEDEAAPAEAVAATGELAALGLSARIEKALADAGVTSVAALNALLAEGDDAALALPGIGAKAVEEIRERIGQAG